MTAIHVGVGERCRAPAMAAMGQAASQEARSRASSVKVAEHCQTAAPAQNVRALASIFPQLVSPAIGAVVEENSVKTATVAGVPEGGTWISTHWLPLRQSGAVDYHRHGTMPRLHSGTIRLARGSRTSAESAAERRHPLTRGASVLLTQC